MKVGVCGGGFGNGFLPSFAAHPRVDALSIAELDPELRRAMQDLAPSARVCTSFDELCTDRELDAVAIFTPPWLHAEHTLQALRAGKHVMCAVPAALTLAELGEIVDEVERTGLHYAMAETHTYSTPFLYCRSRFRQGDFGRFVFGDAQNIYHPAHYSFWARDFYASYPPLLYATHTTTMIVAVAGNRLTRVAATGFTGIHESLRDRKRLDAFRDNEFGSESGLFLSDDGGSCRITEARVIGNSPGSDAMFTFWGTDGSFEGNVDRRIWSSAEPAERVDVTELLGLDTRRSPVFPDRELPRPDRTKEFFAELSENHPALLSFGFLVDDFVRACTDGRRAFNDLWLATRLTAPGIVAHESAKRDGEWLEIPDFGEHPDGPWEPDALDLSPFDRELDERPLDSVRRGEIHPTPSETSRGEIAR